MIHFLSFFVLFELPPAFNIRVSNFIFAAEYDRLHNSGCQVEAVLSKCENVHRIDHEIGLRSILKCYTFARFPKGVRKVRRGKIDARKERQEKYG